MKSYDSMEAMFDDMARAEKEANERVLPQQREVDYGSYWYTFAHDIGIWIFGRVHTQEETTESSRRLCEDDEEAQGEIDMLADAHARGYRFGMAYSVAEPRGELGSTHIASMLGPLTEEQFKDAQSVGWEPSLILWLPFQHAGDAMRARAALAEREAQ